MQPTGRRKPTSQRQRQGAFENTANIAREMIEDERRRRQEKPPCCVHARLAREARRHARERLVNSRDVTR